MTLVLATYVIFPNFYATETYTLVLSLSCQEVLPVQISYTGKAVLKSTISLQASTEKRKTQKRRSENGEASAHVREFSPARSDDPVIWPRGVLPDTSPSLCRPAASIHACCFLFSFSFCFSRVFLDWIADLLSSAIS